MNRGIEDLLTVQVAAETYVQPAAGGATTPTGGPKTPVGEGKTGKAGKSKAKSKAGESTGESKAGKSR